MIPDIASQENLFSLIANSLCPTIFGHQLVKGTPTGGGRPQVLPFACGA
jgi:formyltetrahydrofolate synthetase